MMFPPTSYRTLPRLKSHVHPRFAIFNAGVKIEILRRDEHELLKVFNDYPSLVKVAFIYKAWRRIIPVRAVAQKSYVDPNEELVPISDDDSGNLSDRSYRPLTKSGRGDGFHLRRRTRSAVVEHDDQCNQSQSGRGGTKTRKTSVKRKREVPAVNKRKVLSESSTYNQQFLSQATLSRFNQQYGEGVWTGDRIRHWSHWNAFPKKRRLVTSLSVF